MTEPRGVDDRLDWFLTHDPSGPGMCAQHCWHALGGDRGNPPAWGTSDANEVHSKVKAAGRYWTTPPPRGALILWKYGANGHAALAYDDGKIATTDPGNGEPTGVEPIGYPARWGATNYIWTDTYNGVLFDVGSEDDMPTSEQIADAVWAAKTTDPEQGDEVSMRELIRRTRTVATQARDEIREHTDET